MSDSEQEPTTPRSRIASPEECAQDLEFFREQLTETRVSPEKMRAIIEEVTWPVVSVGFCPLSAQEAQILEHLSAMELTIAQKKQMESIRADLNGVLAARLALTEEE